MNVVKQFGCQVSREVRQKATKLTLLKISCLRTVSKEQRDSIVTKTLKREFWYQLTYRKNWLIMLISNI